MRLERVIAAAASFGAAVLLAGSAIAAPPVSTLMPALAVYVDGIAAAHAAAATCVAPKSPAANEADWTEAKGIFIATLWAAGFPVDFVRTAEQRLDAPPPATKPDCSDPGLIGRLGPPTQQGWVSAVTQTLKSIDLPVVMEPVSAPLWNQAKALIGSEAKAEKRLLDCVAVSRPEKLPMLVYAWDGMISKLIVELARRGVPHDELMASLGTIDANTLWQRAPTDGEAELRDTCAKDQSWQVRLVSRSFGELEGDTEKLLPPAPNGQASTPTP